MRFFWHPGRVPSPSLWSLPLDAPCDDITEEMPPRPQGGFRLDPLPGHPKRPMTISGDRNLAADPCGAGPIQASSDGGACDE